MIVRRTHVRVQLYLHHGDLHAGDGAHVGVVVQEEVVDDGRGLREQMGLSEHSARV